MSVVAPCLNEARHIEHLLDALYAQEFRDFEIILVDGRSTDETRDIIRRYAGRHIDLSIKLLDNPRRAIPSALNLGILNARGAIIARLDAHSRPAPDYLDRCIDALAKSGADVVGGKWKIRPGASSRVAQAIAIAVGSPLGAGNALYRLESALTTQDTDTVPFGTFRRLVWSKGGGYDESLLTNEDYEFNWRVRQQGGRVYFDPTIQCEYFARPTYRALFQQYWRYGWWKGRMLRRHPRSLQPRQAAPMVWVVGNMLLLALSLFWPPSCLAVGLLWLSYVTALGAHTVWLLGWQGLLWPLIVWAYVIIHGTWGCAAFWGLLFNRGLVAVHE